MGNVLVLELMDLGHTFDGGLAIGASVGISHVLRASTNKNRVVGMRLDVLLQILGSLE